MSKKKPVAYVLVGGGSGGHIVPLIPVAEAIKELDSSARIAHIGHKGDSLNSITADYPGIDDVYEVSAGKLRRYHGESWLRRVFDIKTLFFNVRDFFRFIHGIAQAWLLLGRLRPKAIFMKGGYVCANVGIAAQMRKIPYMTHDSDAMISLAHKVIAKNAALHTTAMPPEYYAQFDQSKTVQVGVPIRSTFNSANNESDKLSAKKTLGIPANAKFVLVTGGGLGAKKLNDAVIESAVEIFQDTSVFVTLLTGTKLFNEVKQKYNSLADSAKERFKIEAFTQEMQLYSAASDLIITRASATALSEFGAQSKACVIVPNPLLSGGHQLKNAQALAQEKAVKVLEEKELQNSLANVVKELLESDEERVRLGKALQNAVRPDAAERIASLLKKIGKR